MWRSVALIGALLALASWMALSLVAQPPRIEETLRLETERVLAEAGLADVRAAVNGRDARLEGLVASDAGRLEAERLVASVAGVRVVDNLLAVREVAQATEEAPATYLEISVLAAGMSLRGAVPSKALRREVLERAQQLFGIDRVEEQLTVDVAVAGVAVASAAAVVSVLAEAGEGVRARLKGDSLRLSGTVASVEVRRRVEREARAAAPGVRLFFSLLTVNAGGVTENEAGGS